MTDNKEELRKRLERMEGQLRKKTDRYLTSAGECMELVLDYRKYESTKVD
jgi:DNA-binding FrmR family transcriptional regulator